MPQLTSAQIVINTRTLRIDGQTYSLSNLARVQIVDITKPPRATKGNVGLGCLTILGTFFLVNTIAYFANLAPLILVAWLAPPILGAIVMQKTKKIHTPASRYALILETTGKPRISLVSTSKDELERASTPIINAMENPPEVEQVYTVHNVVSGDQYNLTGDHNIGKWGEL